MSGEKLKIWVIYNPESMVKGSWKRARQGKMYHFFLEGKKTACGECLEPALFWFKQVREVRKCKQCKKRVNGLGV
jgi:hypothetical protein